MASDSRPTIVYVVGTRPEVIRSALVLRELKANEAFNSIVLHTGQHYDDLMNDVFFRELAVPSPDINLAVGSGSPGAQVADIISRAAGYFGEIKADVVAVFGDTNSSLGAALAANKMDIPLVHLEAGCREWEMSMPEEINRRLIDHCSNVLLPVSELCVRNLESERVPGEIVNVGDPLFDVYKSYRESGRTEQSIAARGLDPEGYGVLTLHRAHNVDDPDNLRSIINGLRAMGDLPIIFPIHPRTRARIKAHGWPDADLEHLTLIDPVGYGDILALVAHAKVVLTDSGGLQKEAFWAGVPCITFREHTAWVETVDLGRNVLTSSDEARVTAAIADAVVGKVARIDPASITNPYWQPDTTARIVELIGSAAGRGWDS